LGNKVVAAMDMTEGEAEKDEVEIEGEEDSEPTRYLPCEPIPPAKEVEEHRCSHIPFRSWCKWCMMGRGLGLQHRGGSAQSSVPVVGLDYFFITSGGVKKKSELIEDGITEEGIDTAREQGEIIKCLIIRCAKFKYLTAHCVPCKGADEEQYVVNLVTTDIEWLGYVRLIIKADNEPALQALVTQSLEAIRVQCKGL
jgi:hypothetical protein